MKVLKSGICAVLTTLIFIFAGNALPASAAAKRYAYADDGSAVYFCAEKSTDSALFIIPETYCVEILAEEGIWYYVKYAQDDGLYRAKYGYCLKAEVTPLDEPPENVYLNYPVTVKFRTDEINSMLPALEIEMTAAYYGEYVSGKTTLSYVYCAEKFGYVPLTVDAYPKNELQKPTVGGDVKPAETDSSATWIAVAVISGVALIAIIALYFSSKKKPV
ncbi:MAG: hypothetical protein K2N30_03405 [Clostridia bacterium]|nr:hypothetical protein [Clostridia bacterium]